MEITIPFPVINIKTNKTENSFLRIKYACEQPKENEKSVRYILDDEVIFGDIYKRYDFSLHINQEVYQNNHSLFFYFEDDLTNIYRKIKNKYMMKCCFTCQWSDYSPYGNSDIYEYPVRVHFGDKVTKSALVSELTKYDQNIMPAYGGGAISRHI